jgi:hypothetical protein
VRYLMANAAYAAARECVLARNPSVDCANTRAQPRMDVFRSACKNLKAEGQNSHPGGLPADINVYDVTVSCEFNGGAGLGYLTANRITIGTMKVVVQMPF